MMMSTDKLEPGMEVAADIMNLNNMLLMAKGAILSERSIRLMKTWGIEGINIVGDEPEAVEAESVHISSETLQKAEEWVKNRFQHVTSPASAVKIIKALAIKRTARRLYRQANSPQPAS